MPRALAGLVAGLLLAGCGGPDASGPVAATATATAASVPAIVTPGSAPGAVGTPQTPLEPAVHVAAGQAGKWQHDPPSSGQHWPAPARWGPAASAYPPEVWVHNLEHGGIVVLYRDVSGAAAARSFVQRAPRESRFGEQKLLDAPYATLQHPFALVAWGWLLYLDAWDDQQALAFYSAHVDQGPENVA